MLVICPQWSPLQLPFRRTEMLLYIGGVDEPAKGKSGQRVARVWLVKSDPAEEFSEGQRFSYLLHSHSADFISSVASMLSIQGCTEDKMGIVLSQQFELQRQLDMIEWSENFLRLQRSVLPPADYLASWWVSILVEENRHSAANILVG